MSIVCNQMQNSGSVRTLDYNLLEKLLRDPSASGDFAF